MTARRLWPLSGSWGGDCCAAGILGLGLSLLARHVPGLDYRWLTSLSGWLGATLVIVGVGMIMFFEDRS